MKGLKALSALNTRRKSSESPQVHYVARVPTDASNNTETTLGKERAQSLFREITTEHFDYDYSVKFMRKISPRIHTQTVN